ncbi:CDP-diacylglycerol--inositol 3-phosphatidyltransferase-like [Brevipalpus obovatus]|uniref:CDP-diacylglycerol--inositol 3-phosphatidyltransferase-like n=1 Tax=Brevipalpus obovatus TaxID=246614 RepID=UPI003D9E8183
MLEENIFLFVPNLIGYARIVFALISCYYMQVDCVKAMIFYALGSLMDAVDGYAARRLKQSTRFGSILDQLTDRMGTMCLIMGLGVLYPNYLLWFQLSNLIDIAGHWIHTWVTQIKGRTSHKLISPKENLILRIYYSSRPILFTMCATNELFYISLYLNHFLTTEPAKGILYILVRILAPFAILKSLITIIQAVEAAKRIAEIDVSERRALFAKEEFVEPISNMSQSEGAKNANETTVRRRVRFIPKRQFTIDDDTVEIKDKILKIQDIAAEDLIDFTKDLKDICLKSSHVMKKDIELIERTTTVADSMYSNLKKSSDKLGELVKRSCQYWTWIMMAATIMAFFNMVIFMKLNRKPVYYPVEIEIPK